MDSLLVVKKESESEEQCLGSIQRNLVLLSGVNEKAITIKVQRQNDEDLYYKIGMNMKFKFLMNDYCHRMGFGLGTLKWIGPDGNRFRETQTPLELGLEDGDSIDAFSEQNGG